MLCALSSFVGCQSEMLFHSAIALTALVISVTALVGDAGAQYAPVYGQPSPPRPYAAIPDRSRAMKFEYPDWPRPTPTMPRSPRRSAGNGRKWPPARVPAPARKLSDDRTGWHHHYRHAQYIPLPGSWPW